MSWVFEDLFLDKGSSIMGQVKGHVQEKLDDAAETVADHTEHVREDAVKAKEVVEHADDIIDGITGTNSVDIVKDKIKEKKDKLHVAVEPLFKTTEDINKFISGLPKEEEIAAVMSGAERVLNTINKFSEGEESLLVSAKICCVCIILTSYRDKVVRGLRELAEDVKDEVEVATDVTLEISKHLEQQVALVLNTAQQLKKTLGMMLKLVDETVDDLEEIFGHPGNHTEMLPKIENEVGELQDQLPDLIDKLQVTINNFYQETKDHLTIILRLVNNVITRNNGFLETLPDSIDKIYSPPRLLTCLCGSLMPEEMTIAKTQLTNVVTTTTDELKATTVQTRLEQLQDRIDDFEIEEMNQAIDTVEDFTNEFLDDAVEAIDLLRDIHSFSF